MTVECEVKDRSVYSALCKSRGGAGNQTEGSGKLLGGRGADCDA